MLVQALLLAFTKARNLLMPILQLQVKLYWFLLLLLGLLVLIQTVLLH